MGESVLKGKSFQFAIRIVNMCKYLRQEKQEFVLSQQVLRSGTAIGALIREAEFGQSGADFIHKLSIALKEANETDYWLCLLKETDYLNQPLHQSLNNDCNELKAMLIASLKTAKKIKY